MQILADKRPLPSALHRQQRAEGLSARGVTSAAMGVVSEQLFAAEAYSRGFRVSAPVCGKAPYDSITEKAGALCRVQVKSTARPHRGSWRVTFNAPRRRGYDGATVDVLACYIAPLSHWYLLPVSQVKVDQIHFCGNPHRSKYLPYYENWGLLETF